MQRLLLLLCFFLLSCGGGGSGSPVPVNPGTPVTPVPPVVPPAPFDPVVVSGKITFDRVPFAASGNGLDYNNIEVVAARGVTVRAIKEGQGTVTTVTDQNGNYRLETPAGADRVEAVAQLLDSSGDLQFNVQVVDNANNDALYVLQGSLVGSPNDPDVRNLHAPSGWNGSGYDAVRPAAPFAILDSVYKIFERFEAENIGISLPPLTIQWSPSNSNTSFYSPSTKRIEILGAQNSDTDEYDEHIIVHEWWHYFESEVGRADAIGGAHSSSQRLEIRTAFSEGAGNAFAAIILRDPIYKDSGGALQGSGFQFDIEANPVGNAGWFNEGSVESILYDVVDDNDDAADQISISLQSLIAAVTGSDYLTQSSFTSIYSAKQALDEVIANFAGASDPLWDSSGVIGRGYFGIGETNNAGSDLALPIYQPLLPDSPAQEFCSDNRVNGVRKEYNGVGNRRYFSLAISQAGNYRINVTRDASNTDFDASSPSDPDFLVFRAGSLFLRAQSQAIGSPEQEIASANFAAGTYIIDAHEYSNIDDIAATGGRFCFDIQVTSF